MSAEDSHSSGVRDASQAEEPPWDLIAERIDRFAADWERALSEESPPPALLPHAASLSQHDARHVMIELVKLDLEQRWLHDREPQILDWYAAQLPELGPVEQLPADMIYEELQARIQASQQVDEQEIRRRFPAQADTLCRMLGDMSVVGTQTSTYYSASDVMLASDPTRRPAPGEKPFADLIAGQRIDDFDLLTPLGSGAFARVFLARQVSMERLVALKISRHVGSEPQTLAQLDHPHIVRVFDQRSCREPPARLLYMEVVSGGTLQHVLQRFRHGVELEPSGLEMLGAIDERLAAVGAGRPESSQRRKWTAGATWPENVCRLGADLADGLEYAHRRGVMHRDIKPANVLLSAEGAPKLADFNVSYNGGRADEDPSETFGGSLAYMSPEQLEACHPLLGGSPQRVRVGSDVYSLGVMLWELLTGRRPFRDDPAAGEGRTLVRLQRMIDRRRAADFDLLAGDLPAACPQSLREVLVRCLKPDKADRYQSAAELGEALRLCLNPHCWRLLQPPRTTAGRLAVRWPLLAVVAAGLLPNVAAGAFNYWYNRLRIVELEQSLALPGLYDRFDRVQLWVNAIAFPLGVAIGVWVAAKTLRKLRSPLPQDSTDATRNVLFFGRFVALLLLALWTVSGAVFPIAIDWGSQFDPSMGFYMHFFASLALCGFAATAYPYFLITGLAVRYFVPALVRHELIQGPRRRDLKSLTRLNRVFLAISTLVPMLGILLVVLSGAEQDWALMVVSGVGLVGFATMFCLDRLIDMDVRALDLIAVDD